jgi:hypothetical protein
MKPPSHEELEGIYRELARSGGAEVFETVPAS